MTELKYKLVRAGRVPLNRHNVWKGKKIFLYQLQALRDIPEYGVKAGDFGGYINKSVQLSHEGSCWIGEEAQVMGQVVITDNVYIGGKATIHSMYTGWNYDNPGFLNISDNVKIDGNALIELFHFSERIKAKNKSIGGYAEITGNATVYNPLRINDNAKIHGDCTLDSVALVADSTEIFGKAHLKEDCKIIGTSKILDHASIGENAMISNSVIADYTDILKNQKVFDGKLYAGKIGTSLENLEILSNAEAISLKEANEEKSSSSQPVPAVSIVANASLLTLQEIQESLASYETDIVKIIKYPLMTDRTNPFTQEMVMALNIAKRLSRDPESNEFKDAAKDLEKAFLAAESNALKVTSTLLSDAEKKRTEKAKDLFRIAGNEASSEQEKKVAFIQGFKQLEGVLAVPEVAVDTFRVKIGLKEIES